MGLSWINFVLYYAVKSTQEMGNWFFVVASLRGFSTILFSCDFEYQLTVFLCKYMPKIKVEEMDEMYRIKRESDTHILS